LTTVSASQEVEIYEQDNTGEAQVLGQLAAFVGGIITEWYSRVAQWRPPGSGNETACMTCLNSPFNQLADFAEWPHDVVHSLVSDLNSAVLEVEAAIGEPRRGAPDPLRAHDLVYAAAEKHSADIVDVLRKCVEPKLSRYLRSQASDSVVFFEAAAEGRD
jgi:hypothetical protein